MQIVDLKGGILATLPMGKQASGNHEMRWDGKNAAGQTVPVGLYLVRLLTPGKI